MNTIIDATGISRNIAHIQAVERLETLKHKSGSNPWPVIEECFKIWKDTNPTDWKSYLIYLDDVKETRRDKKFGTARKDPVHDGILRYTLDIPEKVMFMIRCLYDSDELPMDRKFFLQFAKKFPLYKVVEKV